MNATEQDNKIKGNGGDSGSAFASGADGDTREKLMSEMRTVIDNAEDRLHSAGSQTGEDMRAMRDKLQNTLLNAKNDLMRLESSMMTRGREAAQAADTYVKDNPWTSVGLGAAVGVVLGLLMSRQQ